MPRAKPQIKEYTVNYYSNYVPTCVVIKGVSLEAEAICEGETPLVLWSVLDAKENPVFQIILDNLISVCESSCEIKKHKNKASNKNESNLLKFSRATI